MIQNFKLYLQALMFFSISAVHANSFDHDENTNDQNLIFNFFEAQQELHYEPAIEDLNSEQTKIAELNEKEYSRFDVLTHSIFQSERIKFFNFTAFDRNELKNKLDTGHFDLSNLEQLSITFGYGVEYLLKENQTIGYEFLSSFPYDRGRLIRIFWNQTF